ncbi:MAG: T9SS type A sorting domain-containing protein [Bacteroidales bacterium]|nr:T9SS type A sorting domain-containing protein [Bacteroidales bacterium]
MKKFTTFLLAQLVFMLIFGATALAQSPQQSHLYGVSGGAVSNPNDFVEITHFDPQTSISEPLGTIYTMAVQEAIVHENILYVTATDSLVAYDLVNETRLAAVAVSGTNLLKVVGDDLFMSVQYPETSGFLKVFDKNTLQLKATVDGISGETAGMVVLNNKLFVAVPGSYGSTDGSIAVIDPFTYELLEEINLGEGGIGIYTLYVYQNQILTINKTPWGGTTGTLTWLNPDTYEFTHNNFSRTIGKGITIINEKLYLILNNGVGIIDLNSMIIVSNQFIEDPGSAGYVYFGDIVYDTLLQQFYVTITDYVTFGTGFIYDMQGNVVNTFPAGISTEALAVNYTQFTSLATVEANEMMVYPNPAKDFIQLKNTVNKQIKTVKVFNMQAGLVLDQQVDNVSAVIDISAIAPGIYFLEIQLENGSYAMQKIVKH